MKVWRSWDWLAPVAAAVGLLALAAMFALELGSFRAAIVGWAERDLEARTVLAAESLRSSLAKSDFRHLQTFGEECTQQGLRLTVFSPGGGIFFDTLPRHQAAVPSLYVRQPSGEFTVRLGLALDQVLSPVIRARRMLLLAAGLGGLAVLIVFFFVFRQRVRMRELARLERFRRDFIADVSHEIRTPLTGILGAVDLLGETALGEGEARSRLLTMIRTESERLNRLVTSILDLARLERTENALNLAAADLGEIVRETLRRLEPLARERGVRLVADDGVPGAIMARVDAGLVGQALANLVVNAIRHSHSPEVKVAVVRAGTFVELTVEDHGVGIPEAERERVFERFHRVDASRSAEGGAGLGLAIVQNIARLHRGEVRLESVEPTGCRFRLRLPSESRGGQK